MSLLLLDVPTRVCTKCGERKPITEFSKDKKGKFGYNAQCKACNNFDRRERYKKSRAEWVLFIRAHNLHFCKCCGYDLCFAAIEYHHPDQSSKEITLSRILKLAFTAENQKRFLEQVKDCIPLCANCHREVHHYKKILL